MHKSNYIIYNLYIFNYIYRLFEIDTVMYCTPPIGGYLRLRASRSRRALRRRERNARRNARRLKHIALEARRIASRAPGELHIMCSRDIDRDRARIVRQRNRCSAYDGDKQALIKVCGHGGSGDVDEARKLIARGVNIDEQDENQCTALMLAAAFKLCEISCVLIFAGAALDVQDANKSTALMLATHNDLSHVVQLLLHYGASRDMQGIDGKTALQIANDNECTETATLLEGAMD